MPQSVTYYDFSFHGIPCRLTYTGNHGWRLRSAVGEGFEPYGAGQILARDLGEEAALTEETFENDEGRLRASDGSAVLFDAARGELKVVTPSGRAAALLTGMKADADSIAVCGRFEVGERIYGTGERFDSLDRRGTRTEIFAADRWLEWKGNSYVPIPLLLSSKGYGLFVNRYERCLFDLDSAGDGIYELRVMGKNVPMDLYLFATEEMKDVLFGYSVLSGFAPEVADWLYGTQVCRYYPDFSTPEGIFAMADEMKKNAFPWEAVIAEGWDTYDPKENAALAEVGARLADEGHRLMLYHFCGRLPQDAQEVFGAKPEYYVRKASDSSHDLPETHSFNPADNPTGGKVKTHAYLDITNPEALEWWKDKVWGPLTRDAKVRGAKIDFCELFPDDEPLLFADGRSASGAHHWYPTLYNTLMYRYFNSLPGGGMNFSRGGGIGAQRYPFLWAGDQLREWFYLRTVLRGILSAGLSGLPFLSFDMAAYRPARNPETDPEPEVFVRGLEYACFSANIQTHGKVMRPYDFEQSIRDIYRIYATAHDLMRPYLVEQGKIASRTGLPLMRALALWDASDPKCLDCDDEYLLGDAFLAAPVLDRVGKRDVYLPRGRWEDLFTGERYDGGRLLADYPAPLAKIPVFVNRESASHALPDVLPRLRAQLAELKIE